MTMLIDVRPMRVSGAVGALALAVALVACGDGTEGTDAASTGAGSSDAGAVPVIDPGDGGDYHPNVDPAHFVDMIDNPYLPYVPGATWVYEGNEDGETERTEVTVTPQRKEIMGISATVVRDIVSVDGEVIEDTYDWFAQDRDGNVWYLGEDSREYENGQVVSTAGSWEAGVDGAVPGIVMQAQPGVGQAYRQEYDVGDAEDLAEVVELGARESVPFGDFGQLLVVEEWNPLEPDVVEEKYYAPGVGMILEVVTRGGEGRVELVEHTPGG
jgi:hypothetical protein